MTSFCTIFPNYKDFHFYKDPGQIPFRFSKLGYDTSLVCYGKKFGLPETEKFLRVIKIPDKYFYRKFNAGILFFLLWNARQIDILNTYHLEWNSLLFSFVYKILNRKGFSYIKLDNCALSGTYQWEKDYAGDNTGHIKDRSLKRRLKKHIARKYFIKKVDLWSVEDEYSKNLFEAGYDLFKGKLVTVYNGHTADLHDSVEAPDLKVKEDIIMTAGRLGTFQKATETLLESFKEVAAQNQYTLHLAGTVDQTFYAYLDNFRKDNPNLDERVFFHGALNRDELIRLYRRSKIFCLPSRFEGMAIVFPEAMYYKNAILTTRYVSLKYLIDKYQIGMMVEKDNPKELSEALLELINNINLRERMGQRAHEISVTLLSWDNIIKTLKREIEIRANFKRDEI